MRSIRATRLPCLLTGLFIVALLIASQLTTRPAPFQPRTAQAQSSTAPVKLIFIHHSVGENWLRDDHGGLGKALGQAGFFVSDTNYGWGPDAIGDRTDIPNWLEWFRGPNSATYLQAAYTESSQNSEYTRRLADPGGENQVILFKSCFPNSNLAGNPNDPPSEGLDLTVGNAKYVYNELLKYFATRPDKLFVVITAPPMINPDQPGNARAFNTWLVKNWLAENNYSLNNVVVFDHYNILTHPDNHHRLVNGQVEYITSNGKNRLYYDSDGDDHPNPQGSQKATQEFVPLLVYYYQQWQANAPRPALATEAEAPTEPVENLDDAQTATEAPEEPRAPLVAGRIDDFEASTNLWQAFWQDNAQTTFTCQRGVNVVKNGAGALEMSFNIEANTWASCDRSFDQAQNWETASGIQFYVKASAAGLVFQPTVFSGALEARTTYPTQVETSPEMVQDWVLVELPWERFVRSVSEENAGSPLDPAISVGFAFIFETFPDTPSVGQIWIDDLSLMGDARDLAPTTAAAPAATQGESTTDADRAVQVTPTSQAVTVERPTPTVESKGKFGGLCKSAGLLVGMGVVLGGWQRYSARHKRKRR